MNRTDTTFMSIWTVILDSLSSIANDISKTNPRLYWTWGCSRNAAFSFRGYVTFSRSGDPQDEDLVFSLDCKDRGEYAECTTDIAGGDGAVFSDGPSMRLTNPIDTEEMEKYMAANLDFLDHSKEILEEKLN